MKKTYIVIPILLILFILLVLSSIFLLNWNPSYDSPRAQETAAIDTQIPTGSIMGSLSFPSEFMPQLETCAINTQTQETYCTYQMIQGPNYKHGYGYQIQAPPGSYQVYSKINDEYEPYKAYYSKFITCGEEYTCTDHTPITIQVSAGETIRNIDPGDWYAQN